MRTATRWSHTPSTYATRCLKCISLYGLSLQTNWSYDLLNSNSMYSKYQDKYRYIQQKNKCCTLTIFFFWQRNAWHSRVSLNWLWETYAKTLSWVLSAVQYEILQEKRHKWALSQFTNTINPLNITLSALMMINEQSQQTGTNLWHECLEANILFNHRTHAEQRATWTTH